jgi:hypothetical protein
LHVFSENWQSAIEATVPGAYRAPPEDWLVFPVTVQLRRLRLLPKVPFQTPPSLPLRLPVAVKSVQLKELLGARRTPPPNKLVLPVAVQFVNVMLLELV